VASFGDGNLKKIATTIFAVLLVSSLICVQLPVQGGITLWPAKLTITIKSYSDQTITFKRVQVKNPNNITVVVKAEVSHPSEEGIQKGYSCIPDLSWVIVSPQEMIIPAHSEGFYNVTVDIPKEYQSVHYNRSWEVLILFFQKRPASVGSTNIVFKLTSRVFIHTPAGEVEQQIPPDIFVVLWFVVMGGLALATAVFYFRRKRAVKIDKAAMFYVKEKDRKHHERGKT